MIILVSPFLLGVALGVLSQRETVRRFLQRLGFSTVHPIPNAWDYFFGRTAPVWVLVTLHDGSIVSGRFAYKSFASSDRSERDLYLESLYVVAEDGPWTEVPWNAGIWIAGREIKHIEFWEFR